MDDMTLSLSLCQLYVYEYETYDDGIFNFLFKNIKIIIINKYHYFNIYLSFH